MSSIYQGLVVIATCVLKVKCLSTIKVNNWLFEEINIHQLQVYGQLAEVFLFFNLDRYFRLVELSKN